MRRIALLWGLAVSTVTVASLNTRTMPLRPDSSQAELARLGQEYGDLQLWVAAITASTDTLADQHAERTRALERSRILQPCVEHAVPLTLVAHQQDVPLRTVERCLARYRRDG